jgi:hypothetical protein
VDINFFCDFFRAAAFRRQAVAPLVFAAINFLRALPLSMPLFFFACLRVGAPCVGINFLVHTFARVVAGGFHFECNSGVIAELLGSFPGVPREAKSRNNVRVNAVLKRELQKTLAKVRFLKKNISPGTHNKAFFEKKTLLRQFVRPCSNETQNETKKQSKTI